LNYLNLQKTNHLLLFFALFLSLLTLNAQETRNDSIIAVKNALNTAKKSMLSMEITPIISNLELANRYSTALNDNTLKANVLLELARLNFIIENYPRAATDVEKGIYCLKTLAKKRC
jgi:hypothetical protein